MNKKDMLFKSMISTFLVLALFAFKIADLHSFSHDIDSKKSERCELCLLVQNKKTGADFILASDFSFEFTTVPVGNSPLLSGTDVSWKTIFFYGKSLNKAPPTALA